MPTLHPAHLSCTVRQPHQSTDSLHQSVKKITLPMVGPTKPAWHTAESTCLDEDVHLPRQWDKSFGREKASVPRNRKEGPAVVHCADMSPRNASRTRSALWPFSSPADRKSDKGSPCLQKLYSSSRKNTQNCVCSRQTMSALVSAACFLPASGYTSYPQHTTHTTRNRRCLRERPAIGSIDSGLFRWSTKGASDS